MDKQNRNKLIDVDDIINGCQMGGGNGSCFLMVTAFPFGTMEDFWRRMAVVVAQRRELI